MTARQVNDEMKKLDAAETELNRLGVDMGRGAWKMSDTGAAARNGDLLSQDEMALWDRKRMLRDEIKLRAGPRAYEMPTGRGFGPRRKR